MTHNPFEFKSADAHATFDDLPNKEAMARLTTATSDLKNRIDELRRLADEADADVGASFVTLPGKNSMTVKVGGVEISIRVNEPDPEDAVPCSEVLVDVRVPGELDPTVFKLDEKFGTVTLALAQNGRIFSYKDLHPFNLT